MKRSPSEDFLTFLLGGGLFAAGLFLFTSQVMVSSGYLGGSIGGTEWGNRYIGRIGGIVASLFPMGSGQGFGLLMIPFGIGIGLLVANTLKKLGWLLILASSAALGAGILQSLLINFRPTSLFNLLGMVALIASGSGLMLRSVRSYEKDDNPRSIKTNQEPHEKHEELSKEFNDLKAKIRKRRIGRRGDKTNH